MENVNDLSSDVTSDGINQYLYDAEGRICAVATTPIPSMTVLTGYIYDAGGTRVAKGTITAWSCNPAVNGFKTVSDFVLGLGGEQVTEMGVDTTAGSGTTTLAWQHTNVFAGGKLLGTYDKDGLHFYFDDPLGTRRAQTDYAGHLEQTCQSLPFGDQLACTGGDLQAPTEHHFTGKERDTESGNDYFGARYYASTMGRFMSPDWSMKAEPVPYAKLGDPQSLNLYAYVMNNPMTRFDPDGHSGCGGDNAAKCKAILDAGSIDAANQEKAQQQNQNSTTTTVTLNSRPADIPGGQLLHDAGINHEWISTPDGTDVGMGTAKGVPQSDAPGVQTQVVDHTGQVPTSTQTFTGVDKAALATYTKVGTPTGRWVPGVNDCNTWAHNAISQSTPHNIYGYLAVPGAGIPILLHQNAVVYADGSIH